MTEKRITTTTEILKKRLLEDHALLDEPYKDVWHTKKNVKFICACGNKHEKQLRNIYRAGAMCLKCTNKNKMQKLSEGKKLHEEKKRIEAGKTYEITDPLTQKICTTCKYVKHIDEFKNQLYSHIETSMCIDCRIRVIPSQNKCRKRKIETENNDDTKQKCTACLIIKDKSLFINGNKTCEICRNQDRKAYLKNTTLAKIINLKNEEERMCVRCWKMFEKNNFLTKTGHIGVVCQICRTESEHYQSLYKQQYYDYKVSRGPCVDCGESNVRVLDFDHVDQNSKSMEISCCESLVQLKKEAENCVMRCGRCHVRRTKYQCNYSDVTSSDYKSRLEKKIFIREQKIKIGKCLDCEWFDKNLLEALHFDHMDPSDKLSNISSMIIHSKFSIEDIKQEIDKCRLVCVNCHRLRTLKQFGPTFYDIAEEKTKIL